MSYATYTTDALVCGTFNRNTADRSYLLFTREAGMLYADARSAREERSKQRFALQDFSLVRVSLIKGKSSWKVGSIEARTNYFMQAEDKAARGSVVSLFRMLRRFFSGQEPSPLLFDYVNDSLRVLVSTVDNRGFIERVIQSRILLELGYVDGRLIPPLVQTALPDTIASLYSPDVEQTLDMLITKAVSTSHL
jgi:recombinational DNA repair protein (RecF pathway)